MLPETDDSKTNFLEADTPETDAREENRYPIFVASELRDCSKMLEKADIKIIDFDDFVFCTTESKSITFNVSLFIEDDFS